MIGLRQLLIIVLLIAGFWLFRRLRRRISALRQAQSRRAITPAAEMVRCAHCGAYIPEDKAIEDPRQGKVCGDRECPGHRTTENERHPS
jgi:hypothetical protein